MDKQQLLNSMRQLRTKTVKPPGVDVEFKLVEFSGLMRDKFELRMAEIDKKTTSVRALLVSMHLADVDGEPMEFSDAEVSMIGESWPGTTLDFLFDEAVKLSSLSYFNDNEGN